MLIGWPQLFIAVVAFASGGNAAALGFGSMRSSVVLGQTLNLAVPISLGEGETLGAECANATVMSGEVRVPPESVRVRVTQGGDSAESILRISTTTVVDEPVLTVTVNVGCPTRLSRTVTLLADPPLVSTATQAVATEPRLPTVAPAAPPRSVAATASTSPAPRATRPATPRRATRTAATAPARASVVAAVASAPAAAPRVAAAASRPAARVQAKPRLQLEGSQVSLSQAAVQAAQEQALAARATASVAEAAASAAGERIRAMEADMARVRAEAKAQTEALLKVQQQLALDRAQRDQPSPLMLALLGLAAVLAAVVAWLGWRLHKQTLAANNRADWWDRAPASASVAAAQDSRAAEFAASQQGEFKASAAQRLPSAAAPWSDAPVSRHSELDILISPQTLPAPTTVTIPSLASTSTAPDPEASHAMSVDEQIDLEQQADFFIALGHDDAAIDLLMAHMRSTGGSSPLPFLKLLEIHRRRDQREAYERTRVRFNQRFNSVAPEWQADPKAGRKLDDYTLAMGRIQRAWPSPLDAMAELEALLFRRGAGAELFDLPAYQELLFLYQMARDLRGAEDSAGGDEVDVLLPIGGRSAPVAAPEGTIVLRPEFNDGEPVSLDLDLTTGHGDAAVPPVDDKVSSLTLEHIDDPRPAEPDDDFWGRNPDARPTR